MSIHAMTWAFAQDVGSSAAKFLLVCLADCADQSGECYPSLERLVRYTNQDRKTVIANLDFLCRIGLLFETGRATSSGVKLYRLLGVPTENGNHYVYRLTHKDSGEFYIGVRSSAGAIESDPYMGSGAWPLKQPNGVLNKQIIGVYKTRAEAELAERYFIFASKDEPLCRNKNIPLKSSVPDVPPVPKTELVPELGLVPKTVLRQYQKRNPPSTENGTTPVPKTVHRTISEPPSEPSVNQKQPRFDARKHLATLGVSDQIAGDWLALRKTKRAAVTVTVVTGIQREATKAGITLQAALQICCERGWQGFQADWMQRGTAAPVAGNRTMTRDEGRAVAAASRLTDFVNDDGTLKTVPTTQGAANGLEPHATRLLG